MCRREIMIISLKAVSQQVSFSVAYFCLLSGGLGNFEH